MSCDIKTYWAGAEGILLQIKVKSTVQYEMKKKEDSNSFKHSQKV